MRCAGSPTKRTRPRAQIAQAAKRIVHLALSIGVERVHGEIAPARILRPIGAEGDGRVAAIGFDIAAKRRHLEGHAARDQRHGAMRDAGGHGLDASLRREPDHILRLRGCREIHLRHRPAEQRIPHRAANNARLEALAVQAREYGLRSGPQEPIRRRNAGCGRAHGMMHRSASWTRVTPLILSFSPWEKGRLNSARSVQHRPLSHGERDRVRGNALRCLPMTHQNARPPSHGLRRVEPLVEVAQNGGGRAPDETLLELHGVELDLSILPFAEVPHMVLLRHQEREGHFKDFRHLARMRNRPEAGIDQRKHRDDAKTCTSVAQVEQAQGRHQLGRDADLLFRLADRGLDRGCVALLDLAALERRFARYGRRDEQCVA